MEFLPVALVAGMALWAVRMSRRAATRSRQRVGADVFWQEPHVNDRADMADHLDRMDALGRAAARQRWHPAKGRP